MATTRNKLFNDINKGAAWSTGVVFNRTNPIPIDKFSVFQTYAEAADYALNNAVAYPGQLIAVVPEEGETIGYVIQADGSIKAITSDIEAAISELEATIKEQEALISTLEHKLFVGTTAEYEAIEDKIPLNAFVIITDDETGNEDAADGATTSVLGVAVLGQMVLG